MDNRTPFLAHAAEWRACLVSPEMVELQRGPDSCLLPVGWEAATRERVVFARDAESPWFPGLAAQLERLVAQLPGRWRVV